MDRDYLTLGIVSAIVAHDLKAVEAMLGAVVSVDPAWAGDLTEAIRRGNKARKSPVSGEASQ